MAQIRPRTDADGNIYAYQAAVFLGRDINKKRIMRYKTIPIPENMTPRKAEREVQRIADDWEHDLREEYEKNKDSLSEGKQKLKAKITLVDFIDNVWLKKHVLDGKLTPDSVSYFTHESDSIKRYFNSKKPGKLLKDIDKEDVLDFLYYFRNEARQPNGKPYSPSTVKHRFTVLRNILNYAVYIDYIKENPCTKLRREDKPRIPDKEIDFLDEENARKFLLALESDSEVAYWKNKHISYLCWKTLVNMLIVTGLRRGELVGLQWQDLDENAMLFHIRRNVSIDATHKESKDPASKIHIGETKGKSIRRIPISKYILSLLNDLKAEETDLYKKLNQSKISGDSEIVLPKDLYIFHRPANQSLPIYPTEPTKLVKRFMKRNGLPDMSPHDLRHTAASLAIQSGANVKEIQALLGHKDPSTTLKFYAGITEKAHRDTIDGIESILRPKQELQEETQPSK